MEATSLRVLTVDRPNSPPADLQYALCGSDDLSPDAPYPIDLPNAMRALPEGVIVFGVDGMVWAANDAARQVLGREPAYGSPAADVLDQLHLLGGERLIFDRWPIAPSLDGETVTEVELYLRQVSGDEAGGARERKVPLIGSVAPLFGSRGVVGALLTLRSLSRMRDQERLWEEFVTAVVHESRGALTAILGCVSLVESLAQEPARPRRTPGYVDPETHFLGMIKSDAWQINSMLTELIDVARIGAHNLKLDLQPVDIVAQIEDVVEHLAPNTGTLATGHRVTLGSRRLLPVVEADAARIEQIVTSLVMTIARYSPPGAEITVAVEAGADSVVVAVSATEGFISSAEITRLFESYMHREELRQDHKMLGPSLFVARGLVEAHGGRIWAESQPGRGTIFRFSLPLR